MSDVTEPAPVLFAGQGEGQHHNFARIVSAEILRERAERERIALLEFLENTADALRARVIDRVGAVRAFAVAARKIRESGPKAAVTFGENNRVIKCHGGILSGD